MRDRPSCRPTTRRRPELWVSSRLYKFSLHAPRVAARRRPRRWGRGRHAMLLYRIALGWRRWPAVRPGRWRWRRRAAVVAVAWRGRWVRPSGVADGRWRRPGRRRPPPIRPHVAVGCVVVRRRWRRRVRPRRRPPAVVRVGPRRELASPRRVAVRVARRPHVLRRVASRRGHSRTAGAARRREPVRPAVSVRIARLTAVAACRRRRRRRLAPLVGPAAAAAVVLPPPGGSVGRAPPRGPSRLLAGETARRRGRRLLHGRRGAQHAGDGHRLCGTARRTPWYPCTRLGQGTCAPWGRRAARAPFSASTARIGLAPGALLAAM